MLSGCGYVGSALGLLLAAEGHTVFGLRRNTTALPRALRPIKADLSAPLLPDTLPTDLDAAVYAASPGGATDKAYKTAYLDGPHNLLSALAWQVNLRRFVFVSSTGVYVQKNGEWVDEESPTEPNSFSGKRLFEGEHTVLDGPFYATVLCLGGTYGPGRIGMIDRALRERDEKVPPRYTNRIHRNDCAGALRHLLFLEETASVYLGVDHEPTTPEKSTIGSPPKGIRLALLLPKCLLTIPLAPTNAAATPGSSPQGIFSVTPPSVKASWRYCPTQIPPLSK